MHINTTTIMNRVYRVYLIKKLTGKLCVLVAASFIGMTFVSTISVAKNTWNVASQLNAGAFFEFVVNAFVHTEHLTYVVMTVAMFTMAWMLRDLWDAKTSFKTRRIELL